MDLVDNIADIHPKNKLDVGKRLAFWALNKTYGKSEGSFSGPVYKEMKISGRSIILDFLYADSGMVISKTGKNNFSIAGADHVFYPATVKIEGNSLVVSSSKVKKPEAVRYAFTNTAEATLFNGAGLPASSFRTDNWDIITNKAVLKTYFDPTAKTLRYTLSSNARESDIYYDFNKTPDKSSPLYLNPIPVGKTGILYATVSRNGYLSETADSWKIIANKASGSEITYKNSFSPEYIASGEFGLVDGITASNNFQDGNWQGFEGNDLDVIINLGKTVQVKSISCNFLSDNHSFIFLPKQFMVQVSEDGITYKQIGERKFSADKEVKGASVQEVRFPVKGKARYMKVTALNQGTCPAWHTGAGNTCWLFADEIVVE